MTAQLEQRECVVSGGLFMSPSPALSMGTLDRDCLQSVVLRRQPASASPEGFTKMDG